MNQLEQYFRQENICYRKIPESKKSDIQTPDYEIISGHNKVIIEFKEFTFIDKDRELFNRRVFTLSSPPGIKRIRNKLRGCSKQFEDYNSRFPCLCVLRNTKGAFIDLSKEVITMAMFGDFYFGVSLDIDGKLPPIEQGLQYGRNAPSQILRKGGGSLVSAVAVLEKKIKWRLRIFHNHPKRTKIPLSKGTFNGQYDEEWIYEEDIGWKKIQRRHCEER